MNRLIRTLVLCVSVSGLAALAQDAAPARTDTAKQPAATAARTTPAGPARVGTQGMIVVIDPVTKQIRQPDAAEINALTGGKKAAAAQIVQPLRMIQGPGPYGVGLTLDDSSMVYMVVTKTIDGKLVSDCVTGEKAAVAKVTGAQPATEKKVPDER